ncbi:DUF603 domain-containing protein [Borrelia puertoricensis]|uniref:DUF603 domain-containing protein n=1 Tax=Borrelia puertoricensis TaxID=2756107 RepID=UPI001FF65DE7|nr:DUF603 domain-containing protein [Borrelia puertoricensis]UPA18748.1 DUF603 domain-containing protein [Borrelia puertoricensis]
MCKEKKSFDDYVMYFNEGKLNDTGIARELGVSRANVCKMRRKWERREIDNMESSNKLTISEDTLTNILIRASESNAQASNLKSQFNIAKSTLGLKFINSFNRYLKLELKSYNQKIEILESQILHLKENIDTKDNEELNYKILELDNVRRKKEIQEMDLIYQVMVKLKATDLDLQSKFKI